MALIALITICFLACVFLLFVLYQWTRDAKRKTATRSAIDSEAGDTRGKKHPHIVGSPRAEERGDRSKVTSDPRNDRTARDRGPRCNECERTAYERIARSLRTSKRT